MCNNIMQIIKADNYRQLAILGANIIADQVKHKPNSILGLATGSSPVGIYEKLVELYQKEHNGSQQQVSDELFIHRNTVNNQVKKIEKITGLNLQSAKDRLQASLCFYIQDLL